MSEIKLTIDEVIEHCERQVAAGERVFSKDELNKEPINSNSIKQYWEHKQVAEWLKELKNLRGAMERIIEQLRELSYYNFNDRTEDYNDYLELRLDDAISVVEEEGGLNEQSRNHETIKFNY